jgi:hypothetical protein
MYKLAATRFNTLTWKENETWRRDNNHSGCIYGSPNKLKDNINNSDIIFVLEMHNDENKIKGIGIIKKQPIMDKHYRIYSDGNYNRYTYKSQYRIDMSILNSYDKAIVEMFDILLFKSKQHIKRAQGITELPAWIINNKQISFTQFFRELFKKHFPDINTETTEKPEL